MRKREQADIEVRMLTIDEGATYTGRGRTAFRRWADQIGATRRFGRSVRYDKKKDEEPPLIDFSVELI